MSDKSTPDPAKFNLPPVPSTDEIRQIVDEKISQQPPEIQEALEKSKSFYQRNRPVILTGVGILVVMKVNKRMVKKATVKGVTKALKKADGVLQPYSGNGSQNLPDLFDILDDLRKTPEMAYIPHGGGMVHLLGPTKDVIVTVFGEFKNMDTQDVFDYAGRALGMRGYR